MGSVGPLLDRLHRLAAEYANRLDADSAAEWIRYQGVLSLATSSRLRPDIASRIEDHRSANLVANRVRIWRFQDIADALGHIPVCALKGVHLLDRIYGECPDDRTMYDIDVLVPEHHIDEAVALLKTELGFEETAASHRVRRVYYHRCLSDGRVPLEVHSGLGLQFWKRASWAELEPIPLRLHDRDVYVLGDAALLVHLLVHLVQHGPGLRLRWVEDIVRLADSGIDSTGVFRLGRRLGVTVALVAGARLLRQLLDVDVFPAIPQRLGLRSLPITLNERLVWAFPPKRRLAPPRRSGKLRRNASALLLSDSWTQALTYAWSKGRELWLR